MIRLPSNSIWRDLGQTFLVNTLIGIGLLILQLIFVGRAVRFWQWAAINQIYSHSIGMVAAFVMPRVATWVQPLPPLRRWSVYIATLVLGGLAGSVIGTLVIHIAGFSPWRNFAPRFYGSSVIAVTFTLVIGIAAYLFESLKGRVESTTLQLRERQLQHERALKLAAEAQFSSLQSRLQPHFLFNTINSVLSLIREDPAAAELMLQRLARLLRFALDSQQRGSVSLREELRLVTDYLEIEQTRFGDRLRFSFDVDPQLEPLEVPPFSVQTLVENAMKYAVAPRRGGGSLHVSASRDGDLLTVEIVDDGPGFSRDAITAGHGLDTLDQLLRAQFGLGARLEILNSTGGRVRLSLPAQVHT